MTHIWIFVAGEQLKGIARCDPEKREEGPCFLPMHTAWALSSCFFDLWV